MGLKLIICILKTHILSATTSTFKTIYFAIIFIAKELYLFKFCDILLNWIINNRAIRIRNIASEKHCQV